MVAVASGGSASTRAMRTSRPQESKRGHEIAITDKENAKNNCKPEVP